MDGCGRPAALLAGHCQLELEERPQDRQIRRLLAFDTSGKKTLGGCNSFWCEVAVYVEQQVRRHLEGRCPSIISWSG